MADHLGHPAHQTEAVQVPLLAFVLTLVTQMGSRCGQPLEGAAFPQLARSNYTSRGME